VARDIRTADGRQILGFQTPSGRRRNAPRCFEIALGIGKNGDLEATFRGSATDRCATRTTLLNGGLFREPRVLPEAGERTKVVVALPTDAKFARALGRRRRKV
jgi:hypothetical protein